MRFRFLLIISCMLIILPAYPDSLCDQSIVRGKELYEQGKYEEARKCFEYVKGRCPSQEVVNWIAKCNSAIAQKNTKPKSSSTTQSSSNSGGQYRPTDVTPSLSVTGNKSHTFPDYGGSAKIVITCNKDWGFTYCYKDAGHSTKSNDFEVKRDGNTLTISCTTNPYTYSRTAQFDVFVRENKSIRQTIYLSQNAGVNYYINASADGTEFSSSGGSHKITVSTNSYSWYVASKSDWLGYRNKTASSVEIYCNVNNSSSERNGFVMLKTASGDKSKTIYFTQKKEWQSVHYSHVPTSTSDKYYDYNGEYSLKWIKASVALGYPLNVDVSVLDFRLFCFDLSFANFGFQTDYQGAYNWYWQPSIGFDIPVDIDGAIRISAGPKYNFGNVSNPELYRNDMFGLNKNWWFSAQIGYVLEWEDFCSSEFFIRYNGCVAIGATFSLQTIW